MKLRFDNRTANTALNPLIKRANELLDIGSNMMLAVRYKDNFRYNSGAGLDIALKFHSCEKVAPIFFYRPKNPFTKALGYSKNGEVYLNSKKFNYFTEVDIIGLLVHEYAHVAGFSHGSNYPSTEKNNFSVPYYLSHNISKWI
jgi:hypothetical protein